MQEDRVKLFERSEFLGRRREALELVKPKALTNGLLFTTSKSGGF